MSTTAPLQRIDILLRLVPSAPHRISAQLAHTPEAAHLADAHGYTLLHAAASYNHVGLARELVRAHGVDVDVRDEDGDAPLFYAETEDMVRCLCGELGARATLRNREGKTAAERIREDDDGEEGWRAGVVRLVEEFERDERRRDGGSGATDDGQGAEVLAQAPSTTNVAVDGTGILVEDATFRIAPPENVTVRIGDPSEGMEVPGTPDPEIRRRIEQLVGRGDWEGEGAQSELRELVKDVVVGMREDAEGDGKRRRVE